MLSPFVDTQHSEMSSFHLPHGEMFSTLDDVSCLMYLSIRERLLNYDMININGALVMMVDYFGVDPMDAL